MAIIRHKDVPSSSGYYSKVTESRKIVTPEVGAKAFCLYEQTLPPGGYIALHYPDYEESLTFLSGCVVLELEGVLTEVEATTTVFIPPGTKHRVRNDSNVPARLLAVHATAEPNILYPDGPPTPVAW